MKRKISALTAVLLAFGLAACGNNAAQATNDTTQTIQAESAKETDTSNNPEETQQAVTNEAASNTNDEIVGDISSEVMQYRWTDIQRSISGILSGGEKSLASWIHLWRATALMALR